MSTTNREETKRVLFADFAVLKFKAIIDRLGKDGVSGEAVTDGIEFLTKITQQHYDVGVINLLLGGIGPYELIRQVRTRSKNPDIKIIVISKQAHKMNIQNVMTAGATDFIGDPFENEALYYRVQYHMSPKEELSTEAFEKKLTAGGQPIDYINLLLESSEQLSRATREGAHQALQKILVKVASLVGSNRTSLIIVEAERQSGLVLAASDDPKFQDFPISLVKYPEILHVINSGHFVSVGDVNRNELTRAIKQSVRTIQIGSLMVFPIFDHGDVIGVLNVRLAHALELPPTETLRVMQAIATTMSVHSNVRSKLRKIYLDYKGTAA